MSGQLQDIEPEEEDYDDEEDFEEEEEVKPKGKTQRFVWIFWGKVDNFICCFCSISEFMHKTWIGRFVK